MIRRMDDMGRIVLPKELRRTLAFAPNSSVEMFVLGENIHVQKQERHKKKINMRYILPYVQLWLHQYNI